MHVHVHVCVHIHTCKCTMDVQYNCNDIESGGLDTRDY